MTVEGKLLAILVCPLCKGKLEYKKDLDELWCKAEGLAYPVQDDIPIMLDTEARQLTTDEKLGS